MSKKLQTGDVSPDFGLDFSFTDEDISSEFSQESKKSKARSPVGNVLRGALGSAKDTVKSPSFIKETLRKALPKSYGDIADAAEEVSTGFWELQDETIKELKPGVGRLASLADQMVPENSKLLKAILAKVKNFAGVQQEYATQSASAIQEQTVKTMMEQVFNQQAIQEKSRATREAVNTAVLQKQGASQSRSFSRMENSLYTLERYTTSVTQAYQRKSLELGLRSYLTQVDMLRTMNRYFQAFSAQNEAIIKNTFLPDYVKVTSSEKFKDMARGKLIDKAQKSLFGDRSPIKRGMDNLKQGAMNFAQGLSSKMDMAEMGLDSAASMREQLASMNEMLVSMGEQPITREEMLGMMAGTAGTSYLRDKLTDKFAPILAKNKGLVRNLNKGATIASNIPGALDTLRGSEDWQSRLDKIDTMEGKFFTLLDSVLAGFGDESPSRRFKAGTSLGGLNDRTQGFDKRAHVSLVEVIPGYLSAIHRELAILRTKDNTVPLRIYDYERAQFVDAKRMGANITADLGTKIKESGLGYTVKNAAKNFTGEDVLDENTDAEINRFMLRLAQVNDMDYTPDNIRRTKIYDDLSQEAKDVVDRRLMALFDQGEDKHAESRRILTSDLRGIRKTVPALTERLNEYVTSGYGDVLEKEKLLKRGKDGELSIDEERYAKMLEEHGLVRSDVNVKKGVKPVTATELLDSAQNPAQKKFSPKSAFSSLKKLPLFSWMYREGKGDQRTHQSPMAQDVHSALGEEAAPGGKAIDLQTMNGATIAAVQHLGDEVENVKKSEVGGRRATQYLKAISQDLAFIREIVSKGGGTGGGGVGHDQSSYSGIFGNLLSNALSLGGKAVTDLKNTTVATGKTLKDKALSPLLQYLEKTYKDNKDPVKARLSSLFSGAISLGESALTTAKDFVTNTLPAGFKSGKAMLGEAWKKIQGWVNEARDIYLPGGLKPIITAGKLKAGFYRDQVTGATVRTMDELVAAKGDIVDSLGNVILSLEDRAKGIYDRNGTKIKSALGDIAGAAIGAAGWLKDRAVAGFKGLRGGGDRLMGKAKGFFSGLKGGGGVGGDSHQVLVDIRDILLGRQENVLARLAAASVPTPSAPGESSDPMSPENFMGPMQPPVMSTVAMRMPGFGKVSGVIGKLRDRFKAWQTPGAPSELMGPHLPELVGPLPPTASQKLDQISGSMGGRLRNLWGSASEYAKDRYGKYKAGPQELVGPQLPELMGPARPNAQQKLGVFGKKAKGKLAGAFSFLSGLMGKGGDSEGSPESTMAQSTEMPSVMGPEAPKPTKAKGKPTAADKDGNGFVYGSSEDRAAKQEERKANAAKNTPELDRKMRYKSEENVIDTMMKKFDGLFSMVSGGVSSLLSGAVEMFGVGKGLAGKALGGIVKGAGALGRLGISGVGKLALGGARMAGTAALRVGAFTLMKGLPMLATGLMSTAGAAVGAIGALVTSPVVLGAAAVVGAYYLVKYLRRNKANEFERIRLKQYGFMDGKADERYNETLYLLEDYLLDGKITYENKQASINTRLAKTEEMLDIFKIDKDDVDGAQEWADWYARRFKPFFLTHLSALFAADPKAKLGDVHKLDPAVQLKYLEAISFESGPYDMITSPFKTLPSLGYEKQPIIDEIKALIKKVQDKLPNPKDQKVKLPDPKKVAAAEAAAKVLSMKPTETISQKDSANDKIAEENARKNGGTSIASQVLGEDGGQAPANASATAPAQGGGSAPGSVPMAMGKLLDGTGGMEFLKLKPGVDIEKLHPTVLKNFLAMAQEYGTLTGKTINVSDAFRSYAEQKALHDKFPQKAAAPGRSMHEFGLAIDVASADANAMEELGLMKKYGFTRPVGGEPWHMEPAGIQANLGLAKSNATERDQMVAASLYRGGAGFGSVSGSPLGKRNNSMAMALLDVPAKAPTAAVKEAKPTVASAADRFAANDPKISPSEQNSESKNLQKVPTGGSASMTLAAAPTSDSTAAAAPSTAAGSSSLSTVGEMETGSSATTTTTTSSAEPTSKDEIKKAITDSAKKVGVDPGASLIMAAMESDFRPNAKAAGGASGLFGFKPNTWDYQLGKFGKMHGVDGSSPNAVVPASLMAAEYTKANTRAISKTRPNPTATDLYIAHFLGPTGANRFFSADPNTKADTLFPTQAASNKAIFYNKDGSARTVGEIYKLLEQKIQSKASAHGIPFTPGAGFGDPSQVNPGRAAGNSTLKPSTAPLGAGVAPDLSAGSTPAPSSSSGSSVSLATSATTRINPGDSGGQGKPMTGFTPDGIISVLDKSLGVQKDILSALNELPANLAKAMANFQSAKEPSPLETEKKQNQSRLEQAGRPSVNLQRKVM